MRKFRVLSLFLLFVYYATYAQNSHVDYTPINGNSISDIQTVTHSVTPYLYKNSVDLSGLHVPLKKELFIQLMLPSILIFSISSIFRSSCWFCTRTFPPFRSKGS